MFRFGGFGDGPGFGHEPEPRNVDNSKFYDLLGVEKDATPQQIKKAFRKQAMKHHPDKGGDAEKFKDMQKAYEVLSDKEKRELYDAHGEDGLENGPHGGGGGMDDIFSMFMGGGRRRGGKPRKRRGDDVTFPLKVNLEDLYNGMQKKLRLTKNVLCGTCDGSGSKSGQSTTCRSCRGTGVKIIVKQLGPGMIQQMQTSCPECRGEGQAVPDEDLCNSCHGQKVVKEKKTLEVYIDKGMQHNQRIVFSGEADEAPNTTPGDVLVYLQLKEHPVFIRKGENLIMKKTISLVEALCGTEFMIKHLDDRMIKVKFGAKGEIIRPGDLKCIESEGMPLQKNPFVRGGLFIQFDIQFPAPGSFSGSQKKQLRKLLPPPIAMEVDTVDDFEEATLTDITLEGLRERQRAEHGGGREAYDEDEDDAHGHPSCRQV
eukprot:TRINITY_DN31_c1_g1_i2.p1 TRINITY_DN31_c1_g1~~TRINITY_DN31_c1_g1_i2.p1  ORF type:complete len:441 (-),score=138.51 TRINITY_DN31_c1_g1_i2:242-1522(-)